MEYTKEHLKEISFPLGGIGSGCVGLAGNGQLIDWEIFNRPNKGSLLGYTHFAVKCTDGDGRTNVRILQGDVQKDLAGQYMGKTFEGFGFGVSGKTMCGFPHFRDVIFEGTFPIARLQFEDTAFPLQLSMTAFNPLIPLDAENSSIPAAFFEISCRNPTQSSFDCQIVGSLENPFERSVNRAEGLAGGRCIFLTQEGGEPSDPAYGDLTLACDREDALAVEYWYRGGWQDGIVTYWNDLTGPKGLRERSYPSPGSFDMCSLAGTMHLEPGETGKIRFLISWSFPNQINDWDPFRDEAGKDIGWKNYYATRYASSRESAVYALANWESLYRRTRLFRDTLFASTVPEAVKDAASATLSVLKSPTVMRLPDGSFYGWEGVHEKSGSCEGTCQHVWNYAYALCFLFPDLERSIRDLEFRYSADEDGKMSFRMKLPVGRGRWNFRACVDGQMGAVIKTCREWLLSGDDRWLESHWDDLVRVMGYLWSERNPDRWDADRDGVLEGRQHHTLDMELFGPSSWLEGFYLCALKAMERMADHLGKSEEAGQYRSLFEKGCAWTKEHLFNGSYFIQKIDLEDRSIVQRFGCEETYWNTEAGEIKYQIGEGCEIDQLCGQWHANLCGLGRIFDEEQTRTALRSLYRNNFKRSMREFANPWRIFSVNDDSGTIMCDYPQGVRKPAIPVPYCEETMHGFEYQLAGLMISEGMVNEGVELVESVRSRYNGSNRNPWNEIECGSNYARSMASFALLPILSGFQFDLPKRTIGFAPRIHSEDFRCFFSVGTAWGELKSGPNRAEIRLLEGVLELEKVRLPWLSSVCECRIDGETVPFVWQEQAVAFGRMTVKNRLEIRGL